MVRKFSKKKSEIWDFGIVSILPWYDLANFMTPPQNMLCWVGSKSIFIRKREVLSVPHRFLPDSRDSGGIRCIPEECKLAEGSANIAIPVVSHSGGILAFRN